MKKKEVNMNTFIVGVLLERAVMKALSNLVWGYVELLIEVIEKIGRKMNNAKFIRELA